MMRGEPRGRDVDLPHRFRAELEDLGGPRPGQGAVVALSGGVDSLVLLHLLRFASGLPGSDLVAAHLDHGMRPESPRDAEWLRGLLRAWKVEGRFERADPVPDSEADAREARYDFLDRVRRDSGAAWILTAHHADDQAETVLFRIARGTGLRGLRGIPRRREPGILRPLLPFWKSEIRTYADRVGLRPRFDESNLDRRFARNVVRHDVIPTLESEVAPGTRRALVRLAGIARDQEAAWASVEKELLDEIECSGPGPDAPGPENRRVVLDRSGLLAHHRAVRARLLRRVVRSFGVHLDEAGTRDALAFTSEGTSGGRLDLPNGLVLGREFDRIVIGPAPEEREDDDTLEVGRFAPDAGEFTIGGRPFRARWTVGRKFEGATDRSPGSRDSWTEEFPRSVLRFPLRLRGWSPGDRIRLSVGSRKLKKIFGERRVPVRDRHRWPVMSDAEGRILWIPGLARSTLATPGAEEEDDVLTIRISHVDHG